MQPGNIAETCEGAVRCWSRRQGEAWLARAGLAHLVPTPLSRTEVIGRKHDAVGVYEPEDRGPGHEGLSGRAGVRGYSISDRDLGLASRPPLELDALRVLDPTRQRLARTVHVATARTRSVACVRVLPTMVPERRRVVRVKLLVRGEDLAPGCRVLARGARKQGKGEVSEKGQAGRWEGVSMRTWFMVCLVGWKRAMQEEEDVAPWSPRATLTPS